MMDVETIFDSDREEYEFMQEKKEQPMKEMPLRFFNDDGTPNQETIETINRQLKTIYQQRKNHRLPEWRSFCEWIEELPHSEFITGKFEVEDL